MKLKLSKIILGISLFSFSYGENINYASHDIHTLTIPKNSIELNLEYQLLNDTVDILNLKEKEFGGSSKFDSIGDLDGIALKARYGIDDDLMVNAIYEQKSIQYGSNELKNTKNELFFRYNFFNYKNSVFNSGISIDAGYIKNSLKDFYLRDINEMNDLGNRLISNNNFLIQESIFGGYEIVDTVTNQPFILSETPYVVLKDTDDISFYFRLLSGFYNKNTIYDFFLGLKKTKIKNTITANKELVNQANSLSNPIDLEKELSRDETMYFLGFNITHEYKDIILEFGYEYEKFKRDSGLDYIDFNHIIDMTLNYKMNKRVLVYAGGKIMYRQFNGQIPYLYNEYSQTTYDHKYGYAKFGIQYRF